MSIIRGPRPEADFSVVKNSIINDESLSADALGVLVYLLSKPDNWRVMPSHLQNRFGCGKDRIYRILGDLQKAGYASVLQERDATTGAFVKNGYVIHEKGPLPENPEVAGEPLLAEPLPGEPLPGNPPLVKKESTKDLFRQKTDETDSVAREMRARPSDWPEDFENQWWKTYPRREDKKPAMKSLNRIAKAGKTLWADLIDGTRHYADHMLGKETRFIKLPATFLNAESWKNRYNGNHERPKSFFEVGQQAFDRAQEYDARAYDHEQQGD